MKKEITVGQLLGACVTLLIAIVTGWITMSNKVTELQRNDVSHSSKELEINVKFNKIDDKLDDIRSDISNNNTAILVELQKKENRK